MASARVTTVDEAKQALLEVDEDLVALRRDLERLQAAEDTGATDLLDLLRPTLRPVLEEALKLEQQLTRSAALASHVAVKVRELDTVRARVREAKARVDDVLEATRCAQGVEAAVARGDLEAAAEFIGKYRTLNADATVIGQEAANILASASEDVAHSLRSQLSAAQTAAANTDDAQGEVARVAGLLASVGPAREAQSAYCGWVRKRAQAAAHSRRLLADKNVTSLPAGSEAKLPALWATALSETLETAAGEMAKRLPEVLGHLGPAAAVWTSRALQDGVGVEAARALASFRSALGSDPERHLDSMSLMCSRVALWGRFCAARLESVVGADAVAAATAEADTAPIDVDDLGGGRRALDTALTELVAQYVALEERFLLATAQKAIQMDEADADSRTGKMVDYVFFVLQKSCHRAVNSLSGDAACATVNIANALLDSFLQVQQQMLQDAAMTASRNPHLKTIPYAVPLNNVAQSSEFVMRLRNELETAARKHFSGNARDLAKLDVGWTELAQTAANFKKSLAADLKQVASTLEPTFRDMTEVGAQCSYTLSERDYSARQLDDDDAWPWRMVRAVEQMAAPFRTALLPACWDALSRALLAGLVGRLERYVMGKRYNALGALQLSRDMGIVTHALVAMCPGGRSDVARLNQMCVAIGVEQCRDVEELAAGPAWRLTPGETRRLLARRVDLTPEDVAAVKL